VISKAAYLKLSNSFEANSS